MISEFVAIGVFIFCVLIVAVWAMIRALDPYTDGFNKRYRY